MNTVAELAHKTCTKCGESKTLDCFGKRSGGKDGFRSDCKECRAKVAATYYLANTEKTKARVKKWRLDNREKANFQSRRYQLENPEKRAVSTKKYRLANPQKYRHYSNARRARELANGIFEITKKELNKLYNSPCFYCGSNKSIQMDHVIPINRGGRHSIGNLVPACSRCNSSKKDKLLVEWKGLK